MGLPVQVYPGAVPAPATLKGAPPLVQVSEGGSSNFSRFLLSANTHRHAPLADRARHLRRERQAQDRQQARGAIQGDGHGAGLLGVQPQ